MYGDFSRGHEPDRKRGRRYRRVLLQMGRPVLDSDVAATVDAVLGEVRTTTRALGCAAGSPDLGFLVTPGRLLAVFADALDGLAVAAGTPDAWLDYRVRFAGRYPALHLATDTAAARVTLPVRQPLDRSAGPDRAALWARVKTAVTIRVNGVPVNLTPGASDAPQRFVFATDATPLDKLEIDLGPGAEVGLFLLEQDEAAGRHPRFWVAPGTYLVDGLVADAGDGGVFPTVAFPVQAGFPWAGTSAPALGGLIPPPPSPGDRYVAYLEAWERPITAVEDPGIREEALGATDTSTRTELISQVKLTAVLPAATDAAAVHRAFAAVERSGGELTITVPAATPASDPCALPDVAGYSGSDNRLYRVEVHQAGDLAHVGLKWSRDNGSELFAATLDEDDNLVLDAGTALTPGDIVEVLSHVVDLGDDDLARVDARFVPAGRAVGQLAQLASVAAGPSVDHVVFRLVELDDITKAVPLDRRYGSTDRSVLKLRRWHGTLEPRTAAPHMLEDGITATLSSTGTYRPGQYWQYEARVRAQNANGPWRAAPHGPERRFAPLALLEFVSTTEPLRLLDWLDERFSHPCDLDADDIAFAGGRVGMTGTTVQEAIEELQERGPEIVDASCGELIVRPQNGNLQTVFDTIGAGEDRRICFQPGLWDLKKTVVVTGKGNLVISGAGAATVLKNDLEDTVLRFVGCAGVRMQDITVRGGQQHTVKDGLAGALAFTGCGTVDLERVHASCGDGSSPAVSAVQVTGTGMTAPPLVRMRGCTIEAGHAQVGLLIVDGGTVTVEDNTVSCPRKGFPGWSLERVMDDPVAVGRVARLIMDSIVLGGNQAVLPRGDILIPTTPLPDGVPRFILRHEAWGGQIVTFSSRLGIDADRWKALFEFHRLPGDRRGRAADDNWIRANLRRLRARIARHPFGEGPDRIALDVAVIRELNKLANDLRAANATTAGAQGIVVGGDGTRITDALAPGSPVFYFLTDPFPRPDVRITGNVVDGFTQGIHLGTSVRSTREPTAMYRVTVTDNTVHLRVPGLARSRHGIFVGNGYHTHVRGNTVERRSPGPREWKDAPPIDAIRVEGFFGPHLQVRENSCIGTTNGVVALASAPTFSTETGWVWRVADNAHEGSGGGVAEKHNWTP